MSDIASNNILHQWTQNTKKYFSLKSNEYTLREWIKALTNHLPYNHEPLQYLLIDGNFHGASVGHFRNSHCALNDAVCDLPDAEKLKDEIIEAVTTVNCGEKLQCFLGGYIKTAVFINHKRNNQYIINGRWVIWNIKDI